MLFLVIIFLKMYSKFRDIVEETKACGNQKTQVQRGYYAWWKWLLISTSEIAENSRDSFSSNHSFWITGITYVKYSVPNNVEKSTVLEQSVAAFKYTRNTSKKNHTKNNFVTQIPATIAAPWLNLFD